MSELIVLSVMRPTATALQCDVTALTLCEADYVTRVIRQSHKRRLTQREVLR
jgi:hypothetical protein